MLNWIKSLFKPRYRVVPYKKGDSTVYDIYEWTPEIEGYTIVYTSCKSEKEAEEWINKWGDA